MTNEEINSICERDGYVVGAILEYQWGYDQTNVDYFTIVKRTNQTVWLLRVGKKNVVENGYLSGKCEPDPEKVDRTKKPMRRKLFIRDGEVRGLSIESYGWCRLWDGKPSNWTNYA